MVAQLNAKMLTTSGGMAVTADNMTLTGALSANGQTVVLKQKTNGTLIDLGGADAAGTLGLTDGELDNVTASQLDIGNASSGAITVSADVSPANVTTVHLRTGAGVTGTVGGIVASNLAINAAGAVDITDATTDVDNLAISSSGGGSITFHDADDLTITMVGGLSGITTSNADALVQTGGTLSLGADVSVGSANVTLNSAGAVTQTAGSDITALGLKLLGAGSFTLENVGNNVATLAANVGGAVAYRDADALTIGTVLGTSGITTTNDDVTVCLVTGNLSLNQSISTGTAGTTTGILRLQTEKCGKSSSAYTIPRLPSSLQASSMRSGYWKLMP